MIDEDGGIGTLCVDMGGAREQMSQIQNQSPYALMATVRVTMIVIGWLTPMLSHILWYGIGNPNILVLSH